MVWQFQHWSCDKSNIFQQAWASTAPCCFLVLYSFQSYYCTSHISSYLTDTRRVANCIFIPQEDTSSLVCWTRLPDLEYSFRNPYQNHNEYWKKYSKTLFCLHPLQPHTCLQYVQYIIWDFYTLKTLKTLSPKAATVNLWTWKAFQHTQHVH